MESYHGHLNTIVFWIAEHPRRNLHAGGVGGCNEASSHSEQTNVSIRAPRVRGDITENDGQHADHFAKLYGI
jgi:hypothetical protein